MGDKIRVQLFIYQRVPSGYDYHSHGPMGKVGVEWNILIDYGIYHLAMTNIAMENPNHKWRCVSLGKYHLFLWAIYTMDMLVITRG